MNITKLAGLLLFLIALISCDSMANSEISNEIKLTGIYSDMCIVPESGDVIGLELIVSLTGKDYTVVFQSSEGIPRPPVIAILKKISANVYNIEINEQKGYSGILQGTIDVEGFHGVFIDGQLGPHGEVNFLLKRQNSFWETSPHRKCE